jgi:hypothetical protein
MKRRSSWLNGLRGNQRGQTLRLRLPTHSSPSIQPADRTGKAPRQPMLNLPHHTSDTVSGSDRSTECDATMTQHTPGASPGRRTQMILGSFCAAMTAAFAFLALDTPTPVRGFPLTNVIHPADQQDHNKLDLLFPNDQPVADQRWSGIVIHHLGDPFGTPESIHRQHLSWGYQGLGYHFLIGNGNGLGDGEVHVGYRWAGQLPGAHVVGEAGRGHNEHSIGICLVGNGDNHAFSERQVRHLTRLVQRLQRELNIPRSQVLLHRDIAADVSSPGSMFPLAEFQSQLLDLPR